MNDFSRLIETLSVGNDLKSFIQFPEEAFTLEVFPL